MWEIQVPGLPGMVHAEQGRRHSVLSCVCQTDGRGAK